MAALKGRTGFGSKKGVNLLEIVQKLTAKREAIKKDGQGGPGVNFPDGITGYNKPKKTPSHPTKSHMVVAKSGDQVKTIRFGQQGVSGSPAKEGESTSDAARRRSFKARHAANIAKGKMSAAYWANKVKW